MPRSPSHDEDSGPLSGVDGSTRLTERAPSYYRSLKFRLARVVGATKAADRRDVERSNVLVRYLPKDAVGAEIGVHKGRFTAHLLKGLRPRTLHLLDPWYLDGLEWTWGAGDRSTANALAAIIRRFARELATGRLVLHIGYDLDTLVTFADHSLDWVYLDTTHRYHQTLKELQVLRSKVKTDGFISGDDWRPDPSHRHHGVCKAVREFVGRESFEIVYESSQDLQWIIRPARARTS